MPPTLLTPEHEAIIIELFQNSLNSAVVIPDALRQFSDSLLLCEKIPSDIGRILSNSIYDYCDLICNQEYMNALRTTFNSIYTFLSEKEDLYFKIEGRRKGVVNSLEKMLRLLKQGRSLDWFRDSMGIRVILFGAETNALQKRSYETLEEIIKFMLEKHFTLCESDKILAKEKLDEGIHILIPESSSISPAYQSGVKDYVQFPKKNGYQSLHSVFRARNSSFIEIQVRTEEMHIASETREAEHSLYKTCKYGDRLHSKIDFFKINMHGFRQLDDGNLYDDTGLQTSQLIFHRTKSF